ncbi:MAG TPA: transglutaminase family protein [Opitutaceae bacterium]
MKLHVFHRTRYLYDGPVYDSFNEARLQPPDTQGQRRQSFILKILPATKLTHYLDFYLNCVHVFELPEPHQELMVEATSIVSTADIAPLPEDAALAPLANMSDCARMDRCYDFLQPSHYIALTPEVEEFAVSAPENGDAWQLALAIMHQVYREISYHTASTTVHTTAAEVLKTRRGVCQDLAHVMIGFCRVRRIPARYVSGYIYNGPTGQLKGAQATHAWVEVFLPEHGWRGLDPTNDTQVDGRYVKLAVGRDYSDVSPIKGSFRGAHGRELRVDVLLTRLDGLSNSTGSDVVEARYS